VSEVLRDVLNRDDLTNLIEACIQARQDEIAQKRKDFRESLNRNLSWLDQMEQISLGSWDILAINILWPA